MAVPLTWSGRRWVGRELRKTAREVGWKGRVYVGWFPILERGSGTRSGSNISVGLPTNLGREEALEEAVVNFLHAFSHDLEKTEPGIYASSRQEEVMTYIRGKKLAKKLGVATRFKELGIDYTADMLAFTKAESEGREYITEGEKAKAKEFVEKYGFKKAIVKMEKLVERLEE